MSVKLENVSKFYGQQLALHNVSFELEPGQIVGFIGPNGAGKSTAMKIITGIIPASSGEVRINGKRLESDMPSIRNMIGYLPENNPLYLDMYVREYLSYVAGHYRIAGNPRQRIETVIMETGLSAESHKTISSLSKGYRQRVGLAQAILHEPEILILDEPTSGLDPNQIIEIRSLISKTGKEKTIILSTHIMQEVEAICDRVIIIKSGKIIADGKPGEIGAVQGVLVSTLLIEFNSSPDPLKLEKILGIQKIKYISDTSILLESDSGLDLRSTLFNFAVTEGLTILSMQKKELSLEEVFQELTR